MTNRCRELKSALRGIFLLELYPSRPVAPLISYTHSLVFCRCNYLRVSPRSYYGTIIAPQNIASYGRPLRLQTRPDFTRVAGEARAPGIPPPSRTVTYNVNAISRFSGSRSILPLGCPHSPSLAVRLIAAMCFGPLRPRYDYCLDQTKNCALGRSKLAYLHLWPNRPPKCVYQTIFSIRPYLTGAIRLLLGSTG